MALFVNVQQISLRELLELAMSREWSVAYTPFGRFGLRTYIKHATPWKGLKGDAFWKEAEKHGRLKEGLETAITISKAAKGQHGVALVHMPDGSYALMPYKSASQMIRQGKIKAEDVVATAPTYYGLVGRPEFEEMARKGKILQPIVY